MTTASRRLIFYMLKEKSENATFVFVLNRLLSVNFKYNFDNFAAFFDDFVIAIEFYCKKNRLKPNETSNI